MTVTAKIDKQISGVPITLNCNSGTYAYCRFEKSGSDSIVCNTDSSGSCTEKIIISANYCAEPGIEIDEIIYVYARLEKSSVSSSIKVTVIC